MNQGFSSRRPSSGRTGTCFLRQASSAKGGVVVPVRCAIF